jgi:trans-aconitate 2-methyltransferase
MTWSPQQYTKFEDDRTRPVRDLLAAVPGDNPARVIDLGCGPGNSTEILAERYPNAEIAGLDNSPDMVEAARNRMPGVRFEVADVASWQPAGTYGVILSNAVLHWVPNHGGLLPRIAGCLDEGGSLAVQMPDNLEEPAHVLMRETAACGPWAAKLARAAEAQTARGTVDWYYGLLRPCCRRVDIWRTTYHHVLTGGADAVVEWFKGSGLRPFLGPLDEEERAAYLERYRAGVALAYRIQADGAVLLPFPRLFIVATR